MRPIKFFDGDDKFSGGFDFDWDAIRRNSGKVAVFHSNNDPYVSLGNGERIAEKLGIPLHVIPNAGHFNAASGYKAFPALLQYITSF